MIDFVKKRYIFIILSLLVIIGGITYGVFAGYQFDIDFKGGTAIQTDLKQEFSNNDIENIVKEVIGSVPLVQQVTGGESAVTITTQIISEEEADKVVEALRKNYTQMTDPTVRNVQPAYGKELLDSAVLALTVSVILLLLYIAIRFKTLGFTAAVAAIIALLHDALIIIAIYGIFKLPINSTFVAVILTIIGYSINDTIIIYDRIRENKKKVTKSKDLKDTINLSISETMRRSIITSVTTFTAIAVVFVFSYVFNQQVLKEFSFPLMLGVLIGTYSSICIAAPLWYMLDKMVIFFKEGKKAKKKK